MQDRLEIALSRPVVRRALGYAVVVGVVLIVINQGDSLLRGELDPTHLLKMGLTVMVPYMVSTLSSVQAILDHRRRGTQVSGRSHAAE